MVKGELEYHYLQQKLRCAGIDEVGRGCIAGPVYAACALLDYDKLVELPSKEKARIRDSKTLSTKQRQEMLPILKGICTFHIANASVQEIEVHGIVGASFLAMRRSAAYFSTTDLDHILVDGNKEIPELSLFSQEAIVRGDSLCYNIAAASIFAKEARDSYMKEKAESFPDYGFESHVGYGTKSHIAAIHQYGPSPLHRRNFAPIKSMAHH